MVQAIKLSYPQREIADASYALQQEINAGRRIVVGVNALMEGDDGETPILRIDPALERKQVDRLRTVRAQRDLDRVESSLALLRRAATRDRENLMPHVLECARGHAGEGEIVEALHDVWGDYRESPVF